MNNLLFSFVLLIASTASVSFASSNQCEVFLSGLQDEGEAQREHAYVRVIEYYIQQSSANAEQIKAIADQISQAKKPINVFKNSKDSFSQQLSIGVEKLLLNIDAKDWKAIQKDVRALSKKKNEEGVDRTSKKEDSSWVIKPKVVQDFNIASSQAENFHWFSHDEKKYLSVHVHHTIFVYELVDDKLNEVTRLGLKRNSESDFEVIGLSWVSVGEKTFLAAKFIDQKVKLFEFKNNSLTQIHEQNNAGKFIATMKWEVFNGRIFLFVDSSDRRTQRSKRFMDLWSASNIYELVNNRLVLQDSLEPTLDSTYQTAIAVYEDQLLMAARIGSVLKLYNVSDGKFSEILQQNLVEEVALGHVNLIIKDKQAYVVLSGANQFNIYKYMSDKLQLLDERKGFEGYTRTPMFIKNRDQDFMLGYGNTEAVDIYEITSDKIIDKNIFTPQSGLYGEIATLSFKGDVFSAFALMNGTVNVLSHFETGETIFRASVKVGSMTGDLLAWTVKDDTPYLVMNNLNGNLVLVKLSQKVKNDQQ